jgi:DNA-binding response OmpR family regulator
MHALIIEDNILITAMIGDELRDRGFSVACSDTCHEAIALAASQCPDLITADHWLAGESGIDAVRTICEDQHIPVIYIVALPDALLAEEPDAVVLAKPFSSADLGKAIVEVMPTSYQASKDKHAEGFSPTV